MDRKEAEEEGLTHSDNPQIYGNMSKHTEKTNNYMTGSSDKLCEADRWIYTFIPERLPGKIIKKLRKGDYKIEPLVPNIPLRDETKVEEFIAFARYVDVENTELKEGDYVTFSWDKPGERAPDKNEKLGDPKAIEVKRETQEQAEKLAEKIKKDISTKLRRQLEEKLTTLQQRENEIKKLKDSLDKRDNELDYKLNYLKPYAIEIPPHPESINSESNETIQLPENIGCDWTELLKSQGMYVDEKIAKSYLLALVSAFYLGRFILLNGTVGVGKTSIVKHSAKLLGGTSKIIPVRPAWLDPSDLIGFFDPISEIFRPASFLTALNEANKNPDRLHLVCLDELNLAKIENYGADLLSVLEYSRRDNNTNEEGLSLYSRDIWQDLRKEYKYLKLKDNQGKLDFKQKQRFEKLDNLFSPNNYPCSTFKIPENLVLLGTLNTDETTYELSPKLIDRSFVITYPPADLKRKFPSNTNEAELKTIPIKLLIEKIAEVIPDIKNDIEKNLDKSDEYEKNPDIKDWNKIVAWNEEYFCKHKLGRPLGYRAKEDYIVFSAAAKILGIPSDECFAYFLFINVIPRIFFFMSEDKKSLFEEWIEELKNYKDYDPANIIDNFEEQVKQVTDIQRQNINYWT